MDDTRDFSGLTVCVVGGGGYVGSALVPRLLERGYRVVVLDLFIYGREVLQPHDKLYIIEGDVRDLDAVRRAVRGCDSVVHLACISNDPSFELNPTLGRSINYDSFRPLVRAAKDAGVTRFIYASSSAVYGVREEAEVTERLKPAPITDYAKFKWECEGVLWDEREVGFTVCALRPATVCGYAPRQRLDLVVNIMTCSAVNRGVITVMGDAQQRPNIHIEDMVDAYTTMLAAPAWMIDGQTFNVGGGNYSLAQLAEIVRSVVGEVGIERQPTGDPRSYRISSDKIETRLGWRPQRRIQQAAAELAAALRDGRLPGALTDSRYYNIRRMQERGLE